MDSPARRSTLRTLCGCGAALLLAPRVPAQDLPKATDSVGGAMDPWQAAMGHVERASSMAASVAASLNGLTERTAKALDRVETLQPKLASLTSEIGKLEAKKEEILEEYRKGMFCSGCGQTRSQILAKGEKFPHPGQSIVRPTPKQIADKERELQSPIDSTRRRLAETRKDLDDNQARADAGLEQIRVGVRFWRTASSYAEASHGRGAAQMHDKLTRQQTEVRRNLERSQRAAAAAIGAEAAGIARSEVQTWQRLLERNQGDTQAFRSRSHAVRTRLAERHGEQRRDIGTYISRGKLFARVGHPPVVPTPASATPPEMGVTYLMGQLPPPGAMNTPPLASVVQFCDDYRASGSQYLGLVSAGASGPAPVAAKPVAPAAPAPATAPGQGKLLQALP